MWLMPNSLVLVPGPFLKLKDYRDFPLSFLNCLLMVKNLLFYPLSGMRHLICTPSKSGTSLSIVIDVRKGDEQIKLTFFIG